MDRRSKLVTACSVLGVVTGVGLILGGDALTAGAGAMLVIASFVAAMLVVGLYLDTLDVGDPATPE